jgi:hypothetical protein
MQVLKAGAVCSRTKRKFGYIKLKFRGATPTIINVVKSNDNGFGYRCAVLQVLRKAPGFQDQDIVSCCRVSSCLGDLQILACQPLQYTLG